MSGVIHIERNQDHQYLLIFERSVLTMSLIYQKG
ncbi:MAG: hypothetical protein LEGION0403_FIIPPAGN_01817 [Legionella sp.]